MGSVTTAGTAVAEADEVPTGEVLWQYSETSRQTGTPTVVDDVVYLIDRNSTWAVDARTGEKVWESIMGVSSSSPTVVDETLYVAGSAAMYALEASGPDQTDKNRRWQLTLEEGTNGSTMVGDDAVYYVDSENAIRAVDRETETESVLFDEAPNRMQLEPVLVDGVIYVSGGFGLGAEEGGVWAVDADSGDLVWEQILDITTPPTVMDGQVFVTVENEDDDVFELYSFDAETGEQSWSVEGGTDSQLRRATVADGLVFTTASATVYAFDATDGSEVWTHEFNERGRAGPLTIADGTVFVPTGDSEIIALEADTGSERWSTTLADGWDSPRGGIVVAGALFITGENADGDETLFAINAGVEGSSTDSNAQLGMGHHHAFAGTDPPEEPYAVPLEPETDDESESEDDDSASRGDDTEDGDDGGEGTADTRQDDDSAESDDGLPGFGVPGALAALGGGAYVFDRFVCTSSADELDTAGEEPAERGGR